MISEIFLTILSFTYSVSAWLVHFLIEAICWLAGHLQWRSFQIVSNIRNKDATAQKGILFHMNAGWISFKAHMQIATSLRQNLCWSCEILTLAADPRDDISRGYMSCQGRICWFYWASEVQVIVLVGLGPSNRTVGLTWPTGEPGFREIGWKWTSDCKKIK